ncbi:MAG: MoaD/ThiS family protein [Rhodospirillales bacterium]|nr:MoaD/ThiS family protein [Rhodospirillales bacterium]
MILVTLPPALLPLFPGCPGRHSVSATTVAEAIEALDAAWPSLRDRLCESPDRLRRHIRAFVDGEPAGLATALPEGAELFLMTAISGG